LVDGADVEVFAQGKDRAVDNQRVPVVQTSQHCLEDVVANLVHVGNQIERLSSHIDVPVFDRGQPFVVGDETLTDHSSKRQNPTSSNVVDQVGAQYRHVVIANGETGAQKGFVRTLR